MSGPPGSTRTVPVNDLPTHGDITHDLPTPSCVLAIGAHPDDIEFGCGGTLAKWASAGATIHHLVLTDGAKGTWDPDQDQRALVVQRQSEQREAASVLGGGDVLFLGRTDGELSNGPTERWEVARHLRLIRPDVVLGHDPWRRYRLHPDHRHAGFILTDSIVAARDPHFFPDQDLAPHRPGALLLWEADDPNHVEDVSSVVATKVAALMAHASQLRSTMGIDAGGADEVAGFVDRIERQLREHGALAGVTFGESFHLLTDL